MAPRFVASTCAANALNNVLLLQVAVGLRAPQCLGPPSGCHSQRTPVVHVPKNGIIFIDREVVAIFISAQSLLKVYKYVGSIRFQGRWQASATIRGLKDALNNQH